MENTGDPARTPIAKHIALSGGDVQLYENVLPAAEAADLHDRLISGIDWKHGEITIFGQRRSIPRLQAWYGEPECRYTYSGTELTPDTMTSELQTLLRLTQTLCNTTFNCVLCNLYRDGSDSMGWHADDEPELGLRPVIASWTFGAERRFHFRTRAAPEGHSKRQSTQLTLPHNSLLVMRGDTQQHWQHQLPKTRRHVDARINLTYRNIA